MKKVRISKKNPTRILNSIQPHPRNSPSPIHKSLKTSLHIQQLRNIQGYDHQQSSSRKDQILHSHRYKPSQGIVVDTDRRRMSFSPRDGGVGVMDREGWGDRGRVRGLRDIVHRSTDKSPYLQRHVQNKSERKLIINNRNLTQIGRNANKQLKKVRFNSLEQKSSSLEIRKTSDSDDVLKQAKKLMVAGQSRKSMLILKSLLTKDPTNVSALNIASINLYNIGQYEKAAEYLDHLLQLKKDYSMNAYFLFAKIEMKMNRDVSHAFAKLDQCTRVFPHSELPYLEKAQIYVSMAGWKEALECLRAAEKIAPRSIAIQQKIMSTYINQKQYNKALETLQHITKLSPNQSQKYLPTKFHLLSQLHLYPQLLTLSQVHQPTDPNLLYLYGHALYKTNNFLKSYLILQTSLNGSENCTDSVKLMLLILCIGNDFYQAYHLVERWEYLAVDRGELRAEGNFVEGVVCLMKRNTFQGVQKLNIAKESLKTRNDDFSVFVLASINMYIAYGYFCLGNYQKSQAHYQAQLKNYPTHKFDGMQYNMKLNRGFLLYQIGKIEQSFKIFEEIAREHNKKMQPHMCLAIIYVNLYFKNKDETGVADNSYLHKARDIFKNTQGLVSRYNNNIGANFFYHKSVIHSYLGEWKDALTSIDEALQKSEENYWRYYYVRALDMACIHNFEQAINDCTAAINLKSTEPTPYILRSSCFQIEGEGNYAFKDLQSYISLRPNDKQIHKFAGKLLFENGAFEDALAAFNHEPIPENLQNQDAYLTKSKTFFLLGRFLEAGYEMFKVYKINQRRKQARFDGQMMFILDKLLDVNRDYNQIIDEIDKVYQQQGPTFIKTQVFKKTEQHTLKSICYFYTQNYKKSILQLQKSITVKQKTILKESLLEGSTREDSKDTLLYISQMNYNISVCYLMMGDIDTAYFYADKMCFSSNDVFYQPHQRYLAVLRNRTRGILGQEDQIVKVEIFPSRNKISNFLKEESVKINGRIFFLKLCIPFPKVQPPEIFPTFDENLLRQFTIEKIERKSEAPWICKQENTIKFTSKMEKYSRLEIEESATEKSITDDLQVDNSHMSVDSIISRRSKNSARKIYDRANCGKSQTRKKVYL